MTSTEDSSPTGPIPVAAPRWSLTDWQTGPTNRWTFHHLREVVPTAQVFRGNRRARPLPAGATLDLSAVPVVVHGGSTSVAEILDRSFTDGFLVLHDGRIVAESYPSAMAPHQTHVLMSVSKSIIGCVVGILADRGALDVEDPVTRHVPELAGSGYAGARIRHLLDMRSGIHFSEIYLDPDAEVRLLEQVIGWAPRTRHDLPHSMYPWLCTLSASTAHGGPFSYRSCETDILGWVCERAARTRMPELLSELLWSPLGAEQDLDAAVDPAGAVMHDGGLAATLRDAARFGLLLADRGVVDGQQVVPSFWIDDSLRGGADSRAAFAASGEHLWAPGGMYRNQFWLPYPDRDALLCLGIHGQLVYAEPARRLVVAKLSSWPLPQEPTHLLATLAAIDALRAALGS
jgi:CubicO group peptidase (beta-lactamase class C family)